MASADVLLPRSVTPSRYELDITPNFVDFKYSGTVAITVRVNEPTSTVRLHQLQLEVLRARFAGAAGTVDAVGISASDEKQEVKLMFSDDLPVGDGTLTLEFNGVHNDELAGFYRSSYKTAEGETRYMVVTQFEPTDARRCLPCWDEPAIKAVFGVTLRVPAGYTALSNMPVQHEDASGPLRVIRFADSPIMSTYLLAMAVGHFESIEARAPTGTMVRVFTQIGKSYLSPFSLDVSCKALAFLEQTFGIAFPLPKIDLLAVPDFSAGAMENWGLITYRDTALLIDEEKSGLSRKLQVARTVCHELAHQWFGNLVTMEWWTDLWLNEGFARYVEYLSVDHIFPEWDVWTQFTYEVMGRALDLDALRSSHPIEVDVKHPSEINEIFDTISYAKGATVIRMLAGYIGHNAFRTGLQAYLRKHSYANAKTADLWASLSEAAGQPLGPMMHTWCRQMGYPVINVAEEAGANGQRVFALSQQRFLSTGVAPDDRSLWQVPLTLVESARPDTVVPLPTMTGPSTTVSVSAPGWVKFNAKQQGMYRINYSEPLLMALAGAVERVELAATDRLGVQSDAFALCRACMLSPARVLGLVSAYKNETDYSVWADLSSNLGSLRAHLGQSAAAPKLHAYIRQLYTPLVNRLGWDARPDDSALTAMLRVQAIAMLANSEDNTVIAEGIRRFEEAPQTISPDLRGLVYQMVVAHKGEAGYNKILALYDATDLAEERRRCMIALGHARDAALVQRTLDWSLSTVRVQDTMFPVAAAGANKYGRDLAWLWFQNNREVIHTKFGSGSFLLANIVGAVTAHFTTEARATEIEDFFRKYPMPSAARKVSQSAESIRAAARFNAAYEAEIAAYLDGVIQS